VFKIYAMETSLIHCIEAEIETSVLAFRDFPDYPSYSTPVYFQSDWLNEFWDSRTDCSDDYRFVYIGPKGSWYSIFSIIVMSNSAGLFKFCICCS